MSLVKIDGIKHLQRLSYKHPVMTVDFLERIGIYAQLRYKYVKSGWLESLGRGAFKFVGAPVTWKDALRALQEQLGITVHVGAKTVFQLRGQSHYLGRLRVCLFHPKGENLPVWFRHFSDFDQKHLVIRSGSPIKDWNLGVQSYEGLRMSSFERACVEQLALVGTGESFDESFKLMEGLTGVRPRLLQELLESCSSIKAKRLFLYMAEHLNYGWFKKLDLSRIELGSGPRVIEENGKYNSKYMLIAPSMD